MVTPQGRPGTLEQNPLPIILWAESISFIHSLPEYFEAQQIPESLEPVFIICLCDKVMFAC